MQLSLLRDAHGAIRGARETILGGGGGGGDKVGLCSPCALHLQARRSTTRSADSDDSHTSGSRDSFFKIMSRFGALVDRWVREGPSSSSKIVDVATLKLLSAVYILCLPLPNPLPYMVSPTRLGEPKILNLNPKTPEPLMVTSSCCLCSPERRKVSVQGVGGVEV